MKKILIVILIILIIMGSIGALGYFLYQKYKQQDPFELEWIRIYYDYMKNDNEELKSKQEALKYYRENEKIQFCEIENIEKPVMLYDYKELGQTFTNILYINDNNEVILLKLFDRSLEVEYLYDIEEDNYDYYIHETNGDEQKYTKILEGIKANKINESQVDVENIEDENNNQVNIENVYTFRTDEKYSVTTINGEVLEISKFDKKFVKTDLVENRWTDFNVNTYEDEIKRELSKALKEMKKGVTDKELQEVEQKESEVQAKEEQMIQALEEIKRAQEEEARRKAEEEARQKAEEEARKKAEEEARKAEEEARKKAEEEARKAEEEQRRQEQTEARKLYIKIWNI